MSLCKYKNIFGEPGKGSHSVRFMGVAVVDLLGTAAIAYATTMYFGQERMPYWKSLLLWLIVAEIAHWAFCVDTTVIKLLH